MDIEELEAINNGLSSVESPHEIISTRRGTWSCEEDSILIHYISIHGEGRWNHLARISGLKRTGKSCRMRWKNYLRPNVRRGNFTLEEQLRIIELQCLLGNRWSKIAEFLPGRTDNGIKNYWRTRVQKQAKQLKYDVNSSEFRDFARNIWLPRLSEQIHASESCNINLEDVNIIDFDGVGTAIPEPIQMDRCWTALFTDLSSEAAFDAHQVSALTDNLSDARCGISASGLDFEQDNCMHVPFTDYGFQEIYNPTSFSSEELSDMLLRPDDYCFPTYPHEIIRSTSTGSYN